MTIRWMERDFSFGRFPYHAESAYVRTLSWIKNESGAVEEPKEKVILKKMVENRRERSEQIEEE